MTSEQAREALRDYVKEELKEGKKEWGES